MDEIKLPENIAPEVAELFAKPEVMEVLKATIQAHTEPLAAKKDELLNKYTQTKKQLDQFGGLDAIQSKLSAFEQAEAAKAEAERQAALASTDVEAVKKSFQEIIAQKDAKLQEYETDRVNGKARSLVKSAVKEANGDYDLLNPFIAQRTKTVVGADGKINVQVFKADGAPMYKDNGNEATLQDLMNEFKNSPKYGVMFGADNKSGSGARSPAFNPGAAVDNPFMRNTPAWNVTKQQQMLASQPELARMLAKSAGINF